MGAKNQEEKSPTFEQAVKQLESIVEQMESDKMPLDELLVRYEEGIKLVKFCSEKLDAAEKKIDIITRDAAGRPQIVEFQPTSKLIPEPEAEPEGDDIRLF